MSMADWDDEDWVATGVSPDTTGSKYLTYESEDVDYPPTRGERREEDRERERRGVVKHGEGSNRVPRYPILPKITIRGVGKKCP